MARIRKSESATHSEKRRVIWRIGLYIRLSREDGNVVSESVVNQEKILRDELPGFFEEGLYEIVDKYTDGCVIIALNQQSRATKEIALI